MNRKCLNMLFGSVARCSLEAMTLAWVSLAVVIVDFS